MGRIPKKSAYWIAKRAEEGRLSAQKKFTDNMSVFEKLKPYFEKLLEKIDPLETVAVIGGTILVHETILTLEKQFEGSALQTLIYQANLETKEGDLLGMLKTFVEANPALSPLNTMYLAFDFALPQDIREKLREFREGFISGATLGTVQFPQEGQVGGGGRGPDQPGPYGVPGTPGYNAVKAPTLTATVTLWLISFTLAFFLIRNGGQILASTTQLSGWLTSFVGKVPI